ncbi:MAG: hypothetical protein JOZ38_08510 [Candidatus Eremiobacteraeota bacterium]|nr:hypothetical protein [Candidatus Eremiobacteraeota bacterium]
MSVTPYLWLPGVSGTFKFDRSSLPILGTPAPGDIHIDVNASQSSVLSHLNSAALFSAEIRNNRLALFGDFMYLNLSGQNSQIRDLSGPLGIITVPINSTASIQINSTIYEVAPSYTITPPGPSTLDVFAGFRSAGVTTNLGWTFTGPVGILPVVGNATKTVNLNDWIFGVRGRLGGNSHWFFPYYVDFGSGNLTNTTNQWLAGGGYAFSHGALIFAYRSLTYSANAIPIQSLTFQGPLLGYQFRF